MANSLIKDVHTLVDETVQKTDILAGWTKQLPTFAMGDMEGQRYEDVEYVPEAYRFEAIDGITSNADNSDAQSLTDRLIPIRRNKSFNIKSSITTKELRDPRLRAMAVDGFAREIRNKIDTHCYLKVMQKAQMVSQLDAATATQGDVADAEIMMIDNGLSMFQKKIFFSLPHYKDLSTSLANNPQYSGMPEDAYKRGIIPNQVAGFDQAMRADYRLSLPASTATGVTVTGDQSHTVVTKDGNDNYVDNRQMSLTVSATANIAVGGKFTIAGVNRLNPEVREDVGELQTFTVLSVDSGTTLTVSPAIVATGVFRNCSAIAANTSAITFLNTTVSAPSIFYAEDSIKLIPGNLPVPNDAGGVEAVTATTEQGLPMRFTYWYDPDAEVMFLKAVVFFDCEVWLPNQVGVMI